MDKKICTKGEKAKIAFNEAGINYDKDVNINDLH